MKKTPCSIGGYVLKNIEKTAGFEGYGYTAELWKGKKLVGTLEDYGDGGGVNATLDSETSEQEILSDMLRLLELSKASDKSLARGNWDITGYGSMIGFGEILLELAELAKLAKSFEKERDGKPYAVIQTGCSWFEPMNPNFTNTEFIALGLSNIIPKEYVQVTHNTLTRQNKEANAVLLRIVENSAKWDLSFEDYAKLIETAREYNSL